MLRLFYTGIIIGILVSAPMGPIGMLCIQRTLSKGRWHGFMSGLGAALSDFIYAMITCLFVGLIIDFVETNQKTLQVIGSIIIGLFGIYIFRSKPKMHERNPNKPQKISYVYDFITAFLLTFSNMLIVFLYIGLYARFGFVLPEQSISTTACGIAGIATGAIAWWFFITSIVSLFRSRFNIRGIEMLNKIVGTIIVFLSLFGLISIWIF